MSGMNFILNNRDIRTVDTNGNRFVKKLELAKKFILGQSRRVPVPLKQGDSILCLFTRQ